MGLSLYAKQRALSYLVANGTTYYVALFTGNPDATGAGAIEATGSSYARKSYSAWMDEADTAQQYRKNNGAIQFASLSGALTGVTGWGIYDAASSGNLIAFGNTLDVGGNVVVLNFSTGDQPQFQDQQLKFGIGAA